MELTRSKPTPCKCCLIKDFVISDISNGIKRAKRFFTKKEVEYVAKHQYNIPDSKNAMEALNLVRECSPEHLLNHCLRSYAFGVAMAHKVKKSYDKEVLFLGSVMHDLGLSEKYYDDETFEITGAKVAKEFCLDKGIEVKKADLIYEMIALHNSVGIAHKKDPEIALLHFGAGADVIGLWVDDVHKKTLEEIFSEYPRLDFKNAMAKLLEEQIQKKPYSYMKTMIDLGFLKKIRNNPL